MTSYEPAEQRLRTVFAECAPRVLAYALRHTDPHLAHDVVGDVFLVAWRRIDDLPDPALPWLLVVARNTIVNQYRSGARQRRVADAMAGIERAALTAPGAGDTAVERQAMLGALHELSALEREAVLLIAWDGLRPADAALVAGCSRAAFEVRLHRARTRLRRLLTADDDPSEPGLARPLPASEVTL